MDFLTSNFPFMGERYRIGATLSDGVWVREGTQWRPCTTAESAAIYRAWQDQRQQQQEARHG